MSVGKLGARAYYSVINGKVCRAFKEPTQFSVKRLNKNGKEVHEEFYDYISGVITGIKTKDSDFGRFWIITLKDGLDEFVLQLSYSSGYSNAFLKSLPNIDVKQKVQFIPKMTVEEGGKKKSTMFIMQGGKPIKWFYTRENPNGLPELKGKPGKGKDKGKTIWDDSEVMEFLEEMVAEKIVPQLPVNAAEDEDVKPDADAAEGSAAAESEEKLPF